MRTERVLDVQTRLIDMIVADITYGEPVEPETDLLLTGLVDSLAVIQIVAWLEDHVQIEIPPGDVVLENFQTIDLMMRYLESRL